MRYLFPVREPFNAYSHLIGAIISFAWMILLLIKTPDNSWVHLIAFAVFGISVSSMFLSSALYHAVNVSFKKEEEFRRIDHIMIYIVIAGSYTPICAIALDGAWSIGMLLGVWLFATGGVLKKIFWLNAPRWFSTILYLFMGWAALIILPRLWTLLPHPFLLWIGAGGLFYTIGAVIYVLEKPNFRTKHFGFHELWHLFVMGGAFSHFWAVYRFLPGYQS
ncbi:MAG: hemolysin III family protein [Bacteroidota bacterium]